MVGSLLAAAALARAFVFGNYEIPSDSMLPTLHPGDRVFGEKISSKVGAVHAGDIVTFRDPTDETTVLVKRVIALPGQTVDLKDGRVYVDGALLHEPYLSAGKTYPLPSFRRLSYPVSLSEGQVWVMGDNRPHSQDSRVFGPLRMSDLIARVTWRYWPTSRVGAVS